MARNYNQLLTYDEEKVYCNDKNFTYEELKALSEEIEPIDMCPLSDGENITNKELWFDLEGDYSFEYTGKIDEFG